VAIHLIGGLAGLARVADVRDFADAATACGVLGASLYDFAGTSAAQWSALSPLSLAAFADPAPCA
jgi:hypothetical protein